MLQPVILSASEQLAAHLRAGLASGIWHGQMPGGDKLAAEMGVGRDTVEAALKHLEREGILLNQGRRRGRLIAHAADPNATKRLRIGIFLDEESNRRLDYVVELEHELEKAGHLVITPPRTMSELGLNGRRIAATARKVQVDAWMVLGGSREVLEWFASIETPVLAIFGRRRALDIAGVGPDKVRALKEVVDALAGLGHRRIVLITKKRRLSPSPGHFERSFLDFLGTHGIKAGSYHLPEWEESIDGLHQRLESLFRLTPPTALIVDEAPLFVATQHFLARRGLAVPEHVSLVCTDADAAFDWCKPPVSHIRWSSRPVVKRVLQWSHNLSRGRSDLRQTLTPAEFVRGGTIAPAKRDGG